nr:hypothetical protein [Elizabethkingia sp. ASV34]
MKKHLFYPALWGILTLSVLYSCRTDSTTTEQTVASKEKIVAFERFERQNNIIQPIAGANQTTTPQKYISYAKPFAEIIANFIQNHPDYAKWMDESVGVIRLDVASQTFGEDKKAIIFPVTDGNGKVTSAWYGIINEERSYVNFSYMNDNSAELADIKKVFQNYYDKKNKGSLSSGAIASISKQINPVALKNGNEQKPIDIEEVVITKKNPTTPPPDQWVPKYPDEPSGGGGAGSSGPGTGMSGGSSTYGGSMAMPPPPKNPINDLKKYLECLDSRQPANIKVYANTTGMIGHAFISIQQGFNIRTFGFYPEQSFPQNVDGPGIMGDNSGDHYDAVLNMGSVSPEQLQHILRKASEYNDRAYSLYYSNCANFAMDVMQIIKPSIQESKWEKPGTVQDQIEKNGGAKQSGEGPVTHVNCN